MQIMVVDVGQLNFQLLTKMKQYKKGEIKK